MIDRRQKTQTRASPTDDNPQLWVIQEARRMRWPFRRWYKVRGIPYDQVQRSTHFLLQRDVQNDALPVNANEVYSVISVHTRRGVAYVKHVIIISLSAILSAMTNDARIQQRLKQHEGVRNDDE